MLSSVVIYGLFAVFLLIISGKHVKLIIITLFFVFRLEEKLFKGALDHVNIHYFLFICRVPHI